MRRLFATLRVALNDAVRRAKLIPVNPALGVELEGGGRPKARVWTPKAIEWWQASGERPSPVMVWRPEQAGKFLDYAQRHDAVLYPLSRSSCIGRCDAGRPADCVTTTSTWARRT